MKKNKGKLFPSLLTFRFLIVISIPVVLCVSCKKEKETTETTPLSQTPPVVATGDVTNIKYNQATVAVTVSKDGGSGVTKRGICWNKTGSPTLSNFLDTTLNGSGVGSFSANAGALTENTQYYVAAYATNSTGTAYGEVKQFNVPQLSLPQVMTNDVTNIASTSATCGGIMTSDGNGTVSDRGVCWNKTGNPTLSNSTGHTSDGTGTGTFTSSLTGLNTGTIYFVNAYATNEKGTAYGTDVKQFSTLIPCSQLTVTYDGMVYHAVALGTQCWLKENMNIGTRIDGSLDQADNGIIEKYCYDNDDLECSLFGGLYQWDEMMQYVTSEGARGICPAGWHLPTNAEWTTLTDYLGGESVAGVQMKSTSGWYNNGNGINSHGFFGRPGGSRNYYGHFYNLSMNADFWSSSQDSTLFSWYRFLSYNLESVGKGSISKMNGFSARCLQD